MQIVKTTTHTSGYVEQIAITAQPGMRLDDRGVTARTEKESDADAYLDRDFTHPNAKQEREDTSEDLHGLEYLHPRDARLISLSRQGKTQSEIAAITGVTQSTASKAVALAERCLIWTATDLGPPMPRVREACEDLSIEHLYRVPMSIMIFDLLHGERISDVVGKSNEREARSKLREAVKALRSSNKDHRSSLGDLVASHLRGLAPLHYLAGSTNPAVESVTDADFGPAAPPEWREQVCFDDDGEVK